MSFNPIVIDQQSSEFIKSACSNAMQRLEIECGVECVEWKGIHTIAIIYLEEIARELGKTAVNNGGEAKINLHQVMTIGVDMRKEDDAEKEGNLTVSIQAGPLMKQLIKNDAMTEADE